MAEQMNPGARRPNRLAQETSPYLQQHAGNPVDWHAWGPEALALAAREDKPILLSVGYSACHWCHVMAHESFEDEEIAALMNRLFVNIKVDREERPDLDQIYQTAHQLLSQRGGGWPLTMFLAPDGTPFFGGTYFPKLPRHGLPGFADLLERVAATWQEKRDEIREHGGQIRAAFAHTVPARGAQAASLDDAPLRAAIGNLRASFDARFGGFGRAPKFPHPTDLELCLQAATKRGDRAALEMAETTLDRMIDGGIFDQLAGGFSRYSVDQFWMIPHFEKMLYDNAALLAVLALAAQATGGEHYRRAAAQTVDWVMREMCSPEGAFHSSLDADSEHEEGKFYVWDRGEVETLLSPREYEVAAAHWGLDAAPNFEDRSWHLYVARPLAACAKLAGLGVEEARTRIESAREKLLAARARRVRPGLDDKVLVSWNALMIRGMAIHARACGGDVRPARRALDFIRSHMWKDGRLLATFKDGRAHLNAYLDDYAYLLDALIELMQLEFSADDLAFAGQLADVLLSEFEDAENGGFFFTGHSHEALIHRPKPGHDQATPAGNGVAALALNRLAALTGELRYANAARRTVELFYPAMRNHAGGFGVLLAALEEQIEPPATLVLRGQQRALRPWVLELGRVPLPGVLVIAIPEGVAGLPALLDKPARDGAVNAWLCRGVTCLAPMTDLAAVIAACKAPVFG